MRLPDHSGLTVLQRLKEHANTRHIPVHVISVEDRVEAAMHMGAIGYAVKPTTREELKDIFTRLEAKLTQKVKRVLLVEDDDLQRESIARLIGDDDIEITAVGFAQEALDLLRTNDLRLHDHRPQVAGHARQRAAQAHGHRGYLLVPASDRLHRAQPDPR